MAARRNPEFPPELATELPQLYAEGNKRLRRVQPALEELGYVVSGKAPPRHAALVFGA